MHRSIRILFAVVVWSVAQCASASIFHFSAMLSSATESPPNASPGVGTVMLDLDTVLNTMSVVASFSNLLTPTTASHIHCCTVLPDTGTAMVATSVPTFPGFPLGVTAGSYLHTFDLAQTSSYNPAFITANGGTALSAEAALLAGMLAGEAYFNIHTANAPNGEIRGFLVPSAVTTVPEPWTVGLFGIGLAAALVARTQRD